MNIKLIFNLILTTVLALLIVGCSSQSAVKANYYLLNEANNHSGVKAEKSYADDGKNHYISLSKIRLSDYLSQPNIAMQMQDHQLYFSNSHLWAERLDSGIAKSLIKDLNHKSSSSHFVYYDSPVINKTSAKLTIEIEHFIATNNSEVILTGQFWLVGETPKDGKMNKNTKRNFRYTLPLNKDGYPHSISKMRQLLTILSDNIVALSEEHIRP